MDDLRKLLERQSEWQKRRAALSWPEKIRMVEAVRESAALFSRSRPKSPASDLRKEPTDGTESPI